MNTPSAIDDMILRALSLPPFEVEMTLPPKPVLSSADNKTNIIKGACFSALNEDIKNDPKFYEKKLIQKLLKTKRFSRGVLSRTSKQTKVSFRKNATNEQDSENSVVSLRKLSKSRLDKLGITTSPLKNLKQVNHTEHPLAKCATNYKIRVGAKAGRNVSMVLFKSPNSKRPRYAIAVTSGPPGGPHAELRAFDMLPEGVRKNSKSDVLALYTERQPCRNDEAGCERKLKVVLEKETPVYYSVPHTPNARRQLFTEIEFQREQALQGVDLGPHYIQLIERAQELASEQDLEFNHEYYQEVFDNR